MSQIPTPPKTPVGSWPFVMVASAIVVVVILFFVSQKITSQEGPIPIAPPPQPSATDTPSANTNSAVPAKAPANLTYEQALKQYAGKRIQFNDQCQASPATLTVKKGATLMFDNRSNQNRWIAVDGTRYYIASQGYKVINLTSQTLPHTAHIDCGTARNVAQILIQR